ncbi:hypothetical protein BGZ60DRAFT_414996 [Tricladium varicosporioides]|nr:hypothetical protein BGZ60DRAFT_414996 [Hymenoscyphus varicosporioides]
MPESNRQSRRRKVSCIECRKRKQKCKPGTADACYFCSRRFPPVECVPWNLASQNSGSSNIFRNEIIKLPETSPQSFAGYLTTAQNANLAPSHPAFQKPELLHFFYTRVAPSLASIDGRNPPAAWNEKALPWMVHSPLMPEISVLIALSVQNVHSGIESSKCTNALAMRGRLYSLLKDFLSGDIAVISDGAVHALLLLGSIEGLWGDNSLNSSLWAHMTGIRSILRQLGGIKALRDPLLKECVLLSDYQLACTYEKDLFLHKPQAYIISTTPLPVPYPGHFNSPLLDFCTPFQSIWAELDLSLPIASILDIVRSLTVTILSLSQRTQPIGVNSKSQNEVWQAKALAHYSTISSLPVIKLAEDSSELHSIYEVCRMTALAYTFAIASHTKLSAGYFANPEWWKEFHHKLWSVSLSKWQTIPGIFAWILLTCCSSAGDSRIGIATKTKLSGTVLHISVQDFDIAIGILRSFWVVQRWIAGQEKVGHGEVSGTGWMKCALPDAEASV